jgi:AraC-like DNA-binding protein
MNATELLFVLLIFQLLFLSIFLFTQRNREPRTNQLLGSFFLSIGLNLLDLFLLKAGVYFTYPDWAGWGSCTPFLFGPLLYFFTQSIIYNDFKLTTGKTVHFLPFLIMFLGTESLYIRLPYETKERLLTQLLHHQFAGGFAWVSGIVLLQFLVYSVLSLRLVGQYRKATLDLSSNPRSMDVSWLYFMLIFFIVVMMAATFNSMLAQTDMAKYYLLVFNIIMLAVLIFVLKVLFKALEQSHFFSLRMAEVLPAPVVGKVSQDPAGTDEREKIVQTAIAFMKSNKPYLRPELTLNELSAMLSLKPRVLSQAINDIQKQNFFDFVNRYRIEEATRLLTNPVDKKITVLEVLYEVGFNSKSSFNTLFKKYTGFTPTEYRKNQER